jgi:P27 family predicted phage terminase small subunit
LWCGIPEQGQLLKESGIMPNPAKPTQMKIVQGNPGHRPLPQNEPMPEALDAGTPAPDKFATNSQATIAWEGVLPLLVNMRVMTEADIPMLILYCEAYSDEVNAIEQMGVEGAVQTASTGHAQVSAWYTVRKDARIVQMKILSLFGMTPSDRTKVQTVAKKKEKNPFA